MVAIGISGYFSFLLQSLAASLPAWMVGAIVLRYRSPDLPCTFRTPLMPVLPLVGIAFSVWLISKLDPLTWLRFVVWFVVGVLVYAFYGYRRSHLGRRVAVQTDES